MCPYKIFFYDLQSCIHQHSARFQCVVIGFNQRSVCKTCWFSGQFTSLTVEPEQRGRAQPPVRGFPAISSSGCKKEWSVLHRSLLSSISHGTAGPLTLDSHKGDSCTTWQMYQIVDTAGGAVQKAPAPLDYRWSQSGHIKPVTKGTLK